jgi:hypothetical protein
MHQECLAVRRIYPVGMAGALQQSIRSVAAGHQRAIGMHFVGAEQVTRACQRDGMSPARTTFGGEQVVEAFALMDMRRLGVAEVGAAKHQRARAHQPALCRVVFLQHDAAKAVVAGPPVPELVEDIDAAIIIQKQRWIEAAGVEEYRIGPVALNGWRGDDVSVAGGVTQNHLRAQIEIWDYLLQQLIVYLREESPKIAVANSNGPAATSDAVKPETDRRTQPNASVALQ